MALDTPAWLHSKRCGRSDSRRLRRGRCHNVVTSGYESGGYTGDGVRPFALVALLPKPLPYSAIRVVSDWGSSGRRFKSCQPDRGKPRLTCGDVLATESHNVEFGTILGPTVPG